MTPHDFPEKLQCLFEPARYKILFGGRGGAKSWGIARALLVEGWKRTLRVMCAREIQKSLKESCHQLLVDQIAKLGLTAFYEVLEAEIRGVNGTQFLFSGLRHNPASLKSVEGCDIVWVEEAQAVSKESWDILTPSVRKPGSEIWMSLNPRLDSDETYRRFIVRPPKGAVVVPISYRDNPWFTAELEAERVDLLERDPTGYKNVWEGETISALEGAIFAEEIALAEKEHRIGNVPRDRTRPIDTYWDLGFGDCTAIWFAQSMPDGSIRVVDYLENSGKTIEWYVIQMQQRGYMYGIDWLPHDGVDAIIHRKLGGDPSMSIEMLLRRAGRKPRLAPKLHVNSRINSGRTMFSNCWFDRDKCSNGLQALRHYQWAPPSATLAAPDPRPNAPAGTPGRIPLHNWASHGSDAYQVLAVCAKTPQKPAPPQQIYPPPAGDRSWMA